MAGFWWAFWHAAPLLSVMGILASRKDSRK